MLADRVDTHSASVSFLEGIGKKMMTRNVGVQTKVKYITQMSWMQYAYGLFVLSWHAMHPCIYLTARCEEPDFELVN